MGFIRALTEFAAAAAVLHPDHRQRYDDLVRADARPARAGGSVGLDDREVGVELDVDVLAACQVDLDLVDVVAVVAEFDAGDGSRADVRQCGGGGLRCGIRVGDGIVTAARVIAAVVVVCDETTFSDESSFTSTTPPASSSTSIS